MNKRKSMKFTSIEELQYKNSNKLLCEDEKILELESKKCFEFFWNEANTDKNSNGYGLVRDRFPGNPNICSIAAVGYGLSAYVIGVVRKWISYKEAEERVIGTLNTLLYNTEQINGFFYHFVHIKTGKRAWNCEVSIIDTTLALAGAITAGEYFGGEIKNKVENLYKRVNWQWFRHSKKNFFYMGYTPEGGFINYFWDCYAEQFLLYFLGAASPTYPILGNMFYSFNRDEDKYRNYPFYIAAPSGSLFTYQFSFAWADMRNKVDREGVNWWENSVTASKVNRQYCIDNSHKYKTYGQDSWGLTACDTPKGYSGDCGVNNKANDGTVPPCGAAGSIVFTSEESIKAMKNYYNNHKQLWGKYGFKDAYNLDVSPAWYGTDVIGIDKGISLLMIENYRSNLIWNVFMMNKYVQAGMRKVGFVELESSESFCS